MSTQTSNAQDVAERLARFTPRSLEAAPWAMAREAVVAAVLDSSPVSTGRAVVLASRVCQFLACLPFNVWDRAAAPDLGLLLTDTRISAYTSAAGMPGASVSSRRSYRTALREVARAVSGRPTVRVSAPPKASARARAFWPAVIDCAPFPVLHAGYTAFGGALHNTTWYGLTEALVTDLSVLIAGRIGDRGTASAAASSSVVSVMAAAAALAGAVDPPSGKSPTMPARRTSNHPVTGAPAGGAGPGSRRPSRAAALRAARESAARAKEEPATPRLPSELAGMVDGWVPQGWDEAAYRPLADAVAGAVAAYQPTSAAALRNVRSLVVPFAAWVQALPGRDTGLALTAAELAGEGLVDRYVAGPLASAPRSSRATTRTVLRRVVRGLALGGAAERLGYTPVQPPYSPAECARWITLCRQQPTDPLRRSMSAMVALGAGAGLGAEDQRAIAPEHIHEIDLGAGGVVLAVTVPGPAPRGRTVIVREPYAALLREALDLHAKARRGRKTPLCGVKVERRNGANRVAAKAVTATGTGVELSAARLRNTWLVACMSSPVPLGALLHAAGLRTPRTLADLLQYCPPADPAQVAALLARVESHSSVVAGDPDGEGQVAS